MEILDADFIKIENGKYYLLSEGKWQEVSEEKIHEVTNKEMGYIPTGVQIPEKPSQETLSKIADAQPPQMGE